MSFNPSIQARFVVFLAVIIFCIGSPTLGADDVPRMDKDELKALLDNPDVIILDARTTSNWNQSEYKIKGANRLDQSNADSVEAMYPKEKTIVLYCA